MHEIRSRVNLNKIKTDHLERSKNIRSLECLIKVKKKETELSTFEIRKGHYKYRVDSKKSEMNTKFKIIN